MSIINKKEAEFIRNRWAIRILLSQSKPIPIARYILFSGDVDFIDLYDNYDTGYIPCMDKVFDLIEEYLVSTLCTFKPNMAIAFKVLSSIYLQFDPCNLGKPKLKYKNDLMTKSDHYIGYKQYKLLANVLDKLLDDGSTAYKEVICALGNSLNIDSNILIVLLIDNKQHLNHEFMMAIFDNPNTEVEYILRLMKYLFSKKYHKDFDFAPYLERYIQIKSTFLHDLMCILGESGRYDGYRVRSLYGRDVEKLVRQILNIYLQTKAVERALDILDDMYEKYTDENRDMATIDATKTYRDELYELASNDKLFRNHKNSYGDNGKMYDIATTTLYRNFEIYLFMKKALSTTLDNMVINLYMISSLAIFGVSPTNIAELEKMKNTASESLFKFDANMCTSNRLKDFINYG